jgi:hypothetical protein
MGKAADEGGAQSLEDLIARMTAYRERAAAVRRLAEAISDQRATTDLIADAEEFEKKAEAIATRIVELSHSHRDH